MTGLFDRLAARALGAEAIAEPRLVGVFEPIESAELFDEVESVSMAASPTTPPPQHDPRPPRHKEHPAGVADTLGSPPPSPSVHAPESHGHRVAPPPVTANQSPAEQPGQVPAFRFEAKPDESIVVERLFQTDVVTAHAVESESRVNTPSDVSPVEARQETTSISTPPAGFPVDATAPAELAVSQLPAAEAPRNQPAPISVTIGRIEVRAPARAAPPARSRTRTPAPRIPLNTYLRERR